MNTAARFYLSDRTRREIEEKIGLSVREISSMSTDAIAAHLSSRAKHKLHFDAFSKATDQLERSQVYSFVDRLIGEDEIDRRLS